MAISAFAFPIYGQDYPCDSVTVHYDLNSSEICNYPPQSDLELFINAVKDAYADGRLREVGISGSSCLVGSSVYCAATALKRAEDLRDFIIKNAGIPSGLVKITHTGIDWSLLATLVENDPKVPERESILKAITDTPIWISDPNGKVVGGRKKSLMDIDDGHPFAYMREHLFHSMRYARAYLYAEDKAEEAPAPVIVEPEPVIEKPDTIVTAPDTVVVEKTDTIVKTVVDTVFAEPDTVMIVSGPAKKEMTWEGSKVWLKTNIPYWAVVVANLGIEFRLADHWSLDIPVMYSPYTVARDYIFRILAAQPSVRYWLKPDMKGHFFGIHATGGMFNISVNDTQRFQDVDGVWGGGIDYGYALKFSKHWGMEFNIGVGYLWTRYETFYNIDNGASYETGTYNYLGITRLGISMIYKL